MGANPPIRGIVVCVEYDDLLKITLLLNLHHFEEVVVVTAPHDTQTQEFVSSLPKCRLHVTDAFYRGNAKFNKGWAMEEGFDVLGRRGWILVHDADIVLPQTMDLSFIQPGYLYNPPRLILDNPRDHNIRNDPSTWIMYPPTNDWEFPGYFQLFHSTDPAINNLPWYDPTWIHAGRCDSTFQFKWKPENKIRLQFQVLHLGPRDTNWFGRVSNRLDQQPIEKAEERKHNFGEFWRAMGWAPGPRPEGYTDRLTM